MQTMVCIGGFPNDVSMGGEETLKVKKSERYA
jgi:hypothetical protein